MAMAKGQLEAKLKEEHELINRGVLREENPLDLSEDFSRFLEACRRGDLKQCQHYISAGVNINGKDEFDYTPLIIASLCGHYEVAQLLLESGALAERNTFQGERCLYNALNDRIRNLLLQYDYSKSSDPLQPWSSHITSLLSCTEPVTSDITLAASAAPGLAGEEFRLHKFLLAARTPYFFRKFTEAPDMATWKLSNHVPAAAFRIVLHYLYLDDLTAYTANLPDEDVLFKAMDKITKQLEVKQLWEAILAGGDRRLARQRYQDEVSRAQKQVEAFFQKHVLGNKMVVETSKVRDVKWPHDNFIFADCLLCADGADDRGEDETGEDVDETAPARTNSIPIGPAANGDAADHSVPASLSGIGTNGNGASAVHPPTATLPPPAQPRRSVLYPAHKALLVRADYFRIMFSSAFLEAQASDHLRIINVDCAPEVLEIVLAFLYTEQTDIPLELALDVLYVADMLLLEKLKTKAAVIISTLGSGSRNVLSDPTRQEAGASDVQAMKPGDDDSAGDINIYEVLRAAWDLKVQRLEEFAARFLAQRLEHYIDQQAFADLVLESANRLKSRQETDSIELVDDIRYFLSERFRLRFEDMALSDIEEEADGGGEAAEAAAAVAAVTAAEVAEVAEVAETAGAAAATELVAALSVEETAKAPPTGSNGEDTPAAAIAPAAGVSGVLRTLDGALAEDEFDSDALNYQILLGKIDALLERLGLDG